MNNWQTKKLGELAEYINGYPFKPTDWMGSGLPIIRIQNLNNSNKEYHHFNGGIPEKYCVKKGDILISWSASLGSYIWDKEAAWLNQHIFKVNVDENKVNKDFFYFLSITILEEMKRKTHGGTMKHITKGLFENILVKVPSLGIQRQIVEKLDSIRKLQELNQIEIEKAEELFNALLTKVLSTHKDWKIKKLPEIAKVQRGKFTPRPRNDPKYFGGTIPWIQTGDITNSTGIIATYSQTLNEKGLEVSRLFSKGTIVVTIAANIGDFAILGIDVAFPDSVVGIQVDSSIVNNQFLYYQLLKTKSYLNQQATQAAQKNINLQVLSNINIAFPSLREQGEIVEKLDSVVEYKNTLIKERAKLSELFECALNKAMKGELSN